MPDSQEDSEIRIRYTITHEVKLKRSMYPDIWTKAQIEAHERENIAETIAFAFENEQPTVGVEVYEISPNNEHMIWYDGPCLFLTCFKDGPHDHHVCETCGAVRYGNAFCATCRVKAVELGDHR